MRKLITKGEMADLLDLTKSQIRFYEKKGLLKPQIDHNGYAMYDFEELDTLELIILLRELNTPIKEIKKILNDETTYDYPTIIKESHDSICAEIKRLTKQKILIEQRLRAFDENKVNTFIRKHHDERIFYLVGYEEAIESLKYIYDLLKEHNLRHLDYENELYIISKNDCNRIGFVNLKNKQIETKLMKEVLSSGEYFSYIISYSYDDNFDMYIKKFKDEAKKRNINIDDEILFIDHFGRKFYEKHRVVGTLQAKICT